MRKLSAFASKHLLIARILITLSHIALLGLAMQLAALLDNINVLLSPKLLVASILLFLVAVNIFKERKGYYSKRLSYFICGATLFVAMSCFFSNNLNVRYNTYTPSTGTFISPAEKTLTKAQQRKEFRLMLKELRKEIKTSKDTTGQTFAIIGVVLGAIVLLSLVAALSCSIACGGSGALAILVAVAGSFGVIVLMNWAIKSIRKKQVTQEAKPQVD